MLLDVSRAAASPGTEVAFTHREPIPPQEIMGETVAFPEPALFSGTCLVKGGKLFLKGHMDVTASAHCARCLDPVRHPVSVAFDEAFVPADRPAQGEDGEAGGEEGFVFDGPLVEMGRLALTLAVLELPIRFLCGEGCRGLPEEREGAEKPHSGTAF